ncbi:hypothetical protein DFJ74DRAFT_655019 [Hyaloraphidium curvatum]|nr:hypothetical protein DFJ74DRAFT_655019 [Hyaloraphidium curvatum]
MASNYDPADVQRMVDLLNQGMNAAIDIKCIVCHEECLPLPQRMPMLLRPCEHMLCAKCVAQCFPTGAARQQCPLCRGTITGMDSLEERGGRAYRDYLAVLVNCPRQEFCGWPKGEISNLKEHIKTCPGFGCPLCVKRSRDSVKMPGFWPEVEVDWDHPEADCPKVPQPCGIQGCGTILPRAELEAHRAQCPKRPSLCLFPGCGHQSLAEDMPSHMMVAHTGQVRKPWVKDERKQEEESPRKPRKRTNDRE